jgi:hypothetical protein
MSLSPFLVNPYSEDHQPVSEQEFHEVISLMAEPDDWQGYETWSIQLERDGDPVAEESENFIVTRSGRVLHKPEPPSHRLNGFEL